MEGTGSWKILCEIIQAAGIGDKGSEKVISGSILGKGAFTDDALPWTPFEVPDIENVESVSRYPVIASLVEIPCAGEDCGIWFSVEKFASVSGNKLFPETLWLR